MMQKDKRFDPDILVIPVGTYVDFPTWIPGFTMSFHYFEGSASTWDSIRPGRSGRYDSISPVCHTFSAIFTRK